MSDFLVGVGCALLFFAMLDLLEAVAGRYK